MKFLDEAKVFLKSGDGGNGTVGFCRSKYISFGSPDGGNGGSGGNIILRCVRNLNTLIDYRYNQHFKAERGFDGMGNNCFGKNGKNLILNVPLGTQVFMGDKQTLLLDMISLNKDIILLKGGFGGFGNAYYRSSVNRSPKYFDLGKPGKNMWVWFCLKVIADVGLVGLPNSGKSTFLSTVSCAKPKISHYPFTTLFPNLGSVNFKKKSFLIADLPGLITGAYKGIGLGYKFLSHIERCGLLLHFIDVTNLNIYESYKIIRHELKNYNSFLLKKNEIIVLTKIDLISQSELIEKISFIRNKINCLNIFFISSIFNKGINNLFKTVIDLV